MGPRVALDGCGKISPPPGFDPQTVQPIASCYTDSAISAHEKLACGTRKVEGKLPDKMFAPGGRLLSWVVVQCCLVLCRWHRPVG